MSGQKTPVERAIAAFSGIESLAKASGHPVKRIRTWAAPVAQNGGGGRIPAKHQGSILKAARRLKLPLACEDLIDMRVPEDVQ